jgi:hypothetical protein
MKKKIALAFILSISTMGVFKSNDAKAGPFGQKGRLEQQSNGRYCCRFAIFSNQCILNFQEWCL